MKRALLRLKCYVFFSLLAGGGRQAEAAIVTAMLLFFSFSGANHAVTAFREGNRKPVNLLRPILSLLLVLLLLPPMIFALKQ